MLLKEFLDDRMPEVDDLRSGEGLRDLAGLTVVDVVDVTSELLPPPPPPPLLLLLTDSELMRFLLGRVSRLRTLTLLPTLAAADSGSRRRKGRLTFDSAAIQKSSRVR